MSERRTKEEWESAGRDAPRLLPAGRQPADERRAGLPPDAAAADRAGRRRPPAGQPPSDGQGARAPGEDVPAQHAGVGGVVGAMQPPKLAGRGRSPATRLGKGPIYGQVTIAADPSAPDGFTTETRYTSRAPAKRCRAGKALVYTGYQWRGRGGGRAATTPWREVMFVERDWREMWGRWFTGAYDETGIDVKLVRLGAIRSCSARASRRSRRRRRRGRCKIFGANLPATHQGGGHRVRPGREGDAHRQRDGRRARDRGGRRRDAPIGPRDVSVAGDGQADGARRLRQDRRHQGRCRRPAWRASAAAVFPKQLQQFEAVGIATVPTASRTPGRSRISAWST